MSNPNVNRSSMLPAVLEGGFYGLLIAAFFALCGFIGWNLVEPKQSPDHLCAQTNQLGSSAWVACVDRKAQERAQ
ncbi:hypothetical protein [Pseudomonas syringae group genomosp. 3]|nr:hypothetical protein [Pseudomonas syringae group genomosp. 3]MBX6510489.1 hypothetical protein [Pseudomonas syringae pv. tomato]RMV03330.1 hypothetical protein ALP19_102465 [Pseudomonas syringae pv. tomato]TES74669.1 hypothetical protein E2N89_23680 [Pseudomonas syringae pv. tomato]